MLAISLQTSWGCEKNPQDLLRLQLSQAGFVNISELDLTLIVDIPYATIHNFTGQKVYPGNVCYLRSDVAQRLLRVQHRLLKLGFQLKIWDGYRPFHIQEKFWSVFPNDKYVMKPVRGENGAMLQGSKHSRGAAVDVTLTDLQGREVEMPSTFDDFSEAAHRNFQGSSAVARKNMKTLEDAMAAEGFVGWPWEWWHFDVENWEDYDLSDVPIGQM